MSETLTIASLSYCRGAFYLILVLSVIMFAQTLYEIPEMVTGLLGSGLIALALVSAVRHNCRDGEA